MPCPLGIRRSYKEGGIRGIRISENNAEDKDPQMGRERVLEKIRSLFTHNKREQKMNPRGIRNLFTHVWAVANHELGGLNVEVQNITSIEIQN